MSLGADCYTRIFLDSRYSKKETQLFDYIGSSMWAINDMIENDFAGLTDVSYYSIQRVVKEQGPMPIHSLYNLRFLHDGSVINRGTLDRAFAEKLQRRVERFKSTLTSAKNPVFIRAQETPHRLWIPKEYPTDELPELLRFRDVIRSKYGVTDCKIIYVNRDYNGVHDGIVCIKSSRTSGPMNFQLGKSILAAIKS